MVDALGIHVIGSGYGEAIVIEFSDNTAGIIDSIYPISEDRWKIKDGLQDHPIIRFLERDLKTSRLRFALLTHPHADHCLGFSKICQYFEDRLDYVILPNAMFQIHDKEFKEMMKRIRELKFADPSEKAVGVNPGRMAHELNELYAWLELCEKRQSQLRNPPSISLEWWGSTNLPLVFKDIKAKLTPLTPGGWSINKLRREVKRAESKISSYFIKQVQAKSSKKKTTKRLKYNAPNYNLASIALFLEYGSTRIFLCADAFDSMWNEFISSRIQKEIKNKNIHFIKIGHHGSKRWCSNRLFKYLKKSSNFISVVTPFGRALPLLPTREGILKISKKSGIIVTTSRNSAEKSSKLKWNRPEAKGIPFSTSATRELLRKLKERPGIAPLLSGYSKESKQKPQLGTKSFLSSIFLNPDLAQFMPTLTLLQPEIYHRVSLYFDNSGNRIEDKDYYGAGSGILEYIS